MMLSSKILSTPGLMVILLGSSMAFTPTTFGYRSAAPRSSTLPISSTSQAQQDVEARQVLSFVESQGLLQTAEAAARAAGRIIVDHLGCPAEGEDDDTSSSNAMSIKTSIKDIVTKYDKEAQQAIESIVRSAYPTHAFLGEEDVDPGAAASEAALLQALDKQQSNNDNNVEEEKGGDFLWICDPIDGTANFASGLPLCGVTLTVVYRGTPVVGVIYDPHADEMFGALRGHGATLNGAPFTIAANAVNMPDMSQAVVNAGCPADPNAFGASMRGIAALNGRTRGLRMVACSALTTAWIAAGRLSAHFGYDLSSWDLAAGALLIQEAGGIITDLDGSPYQLETRNMLCSCNPVVHEQILGALRDGDAVSFVRAD